MSFNFESNFSFAKILKVKLSPIPKFVGIRQIGNETIVSSIVTNTAKPFSNFDKVPLKKEISFSSL